MPATRREDPDGAWLFHAGADNVGWRDQRYFGDLRADRPLRRSPASGTDPAVLQRRHEDAVHRAPASTLVLDDATQRAIQNGQANLNAYVPLATQFDLRERRDIGHVDLRRDADAAARRHGQLHHAEACRRAAVGRQLRLQQRRRSGAALRLARPTTSPSAPSGRTRATCCASPTTARGSTTSTTRWSGTARCASTIRRRAGPRPHVALAVELGADRQRRRLHEVRARARRSPASSPSASGATTSRCSRSPSIRRCRSSRCRARSTRGRGARLFHEPESRLASDDRLAVQRARAALRLRQPEPAHGDSRNSSTTTRRVNDVADRRARAVRARPHDVRCAMRPGPGSAARADRWLHAQQQRLRFPDLRRHRRGRAPR